MTGAVGQRRVPISYLRSAELPLAPANEQRRIVERIDELFSQIEAGEAALARAKRLLARYRQAVLKAAVTGELTKDWRERHAAELEPATTSSHASSKPAAKPGKKPSSKSSVRRARNPRTTSGKRNTRSPSHRTRPTCPRYPWGGCGPLSNNWLG
jgi:hypothetical protein